MRVPTKTHRSGVLKSFDCLLRSHKYNSNEAHWKLEEILTFMEWNRICNVWRK